MTIKYQYARTDTDGQWTKPLSRLRTKSNFRETLEDKVGPYRILKDDWGVALAARECARRAFKLVDARPLGLITYVRAEGSEATFGIRRVEVGLAEEKPPWYSTYVNASVNEKVARVIRVAYAFDKEVDCLGTQVCKQVSGSTTWSQHAFGKAVDLAFRIPPPAGFDMFRQDALASFLVRNAEELELEHVIHRDHIWKRGFGWLPYSGVYHTHVHVDVYPNGTGVPPCAQ